MDVLIVSATNNAPLAFSILAPSNGGGSDSLQNLTWESTTDFDLGDEVSYQVQLGESIVSQYQLYFNGQDTVFNTDTLD